MTALAFTLKRLLSAPSSARAQGPSQSELPGSFLSIADDAKLGSALGVDPRNQHLEIIPADPKLQVHDIPLGHHLLNHGVSEASALKFISGKFNPGILKHSDTGFFPSFLKFMTSHAGLLPESDPVSGPDENAQVQEKTGIIKALAFYNALFNADEALKKDGSPMSTSSALRKGIKSFLNAQLGIPEAQEFHTRDLFAQIFAHLYDRADHMDFELPIVTIVKDASPAGTAHKLSRFFFENVQRSHRYHALDAKGKVTLSRIPDLSAAHYKEQGIQVIVCMASKDELLTRSAFVSRPTLPSNFAEVGIQHKTISLIDYAKLSYAQDFNGKRNPDTGEEFTSKDQWDAFVEDRYRTVAALQDKCYTEDLSALVHCKAGKGRSLFYVLTNLLRHPDLLVVERNSLTRHLINAVDRADSSAKHVLLQAGVEGVAQRGKHVDIQDAAAAKADLVNSFNHFARAYQQGDVEQMTALKEKAAAAVLLYIHQIRPYIDHKVPDWQAAVDYIGFHLSDEGQVPAMKHAGSGQEVPQFEVELRDMVLPDVADGSRPSSRAPLLHDDFPEEGMEGQGHHNPAHHHAAGVD
jgi:hypothetical protein